MAFPGCSAEVKAYLWNSICQPVLTYGFDSISISNHCMKSLETCQGNLVKKCLGLSVRSRSSSLLEAMHIKKVSQKVKESCASLFYRIFDTSSSAQDLSAHLLSLYITRNVLIPNTLVHRLVSAGVSPTECAFSRLRRHSWDSSDGVVESMRNLLMHSNFIKPYSEQHILCTLLVKSF